MSCRFLNSVTALSLLLGVGTLALWARSFARLDEFEIKRGFYESKLEPGSERPPWFERYQNFQVMTGRGGVVLRRLGSKGHIMFDGPWDTSYRAYGPDYVRPLWHYHAFDSHATTLPGLSLSRSPPTETEEATVTLVVPYWIAVIAAGVLPATRLAARRRRSNRRARGQCVGCGYDLRATPGRCPECGTRASPARADALAIDFRPE